MSERRYDIFLSYSRDDAAFARWLEAALEQYRCPKQLSFPRLRVFRDEHDLVGNTLSPSIRGALLDSEVLLVVCSPAARRSRWVRDEIDIFAEAYGSTRILPVLCAGEPEATSERAAFPDALIRVLPDAFAPDFRRGVTGRERREALLAVIAFAHGCDKEVLALRDEQRARKRRLVAAVGALAIAGGFVGYAAFEQSRRRHERMSSGKAREAIERRALASELVKAALDPMQPLDRRLLFAAEALARTDSFEARQAALDLLDRGSGTKTIEAMVTPEYLADAPAWMTDLAWSNDGRYLIVADAAGGVFSYDMAAGTWVGALADATEDGPLSSASIGPSRGNLTIIHDLSRVYVVDPGAPSTRWGPWVPSGGIVETSWHDDGSIRIVGHRSDEIRRLADGAVLERSEHPVRPGGAAPYVAPATGETDLRPDGSLGCRASEAGEAIVFEGTYQLQRVELPPSRDPAYLVAVHPTSSICAVGVEQLGDIVLLDPAADWTSSRVVDLGGDYFDVAFATDAAELRVLMKDCTLLRVDAATRRIASRRSHSGAARALAADGGAFVCAGDSSMMVYTVGDPSGRRVPAFESVAVSPSGSFLATSVEGRIHIIDVATGEPVADVGVSHPLEGEDPNDIVFARDDAVVARFETFVQVITGPTWRAPPEGGSAAGAMAGQLAATVGDELLAIVSGEGIHSIPLTGGPERRVTPQRFGVAGHPAALSARGRFAIAGCAATDGGRAGPLICLVEMATQHALALRAPIEYPYVSDDGRFLAFDADGRLRLVDLGAQALRDAACAAAGRVLTRAEWEAQFPGDRFTPACPERL